MKIIDIEDKNSLQNAAEVLKKGGILVFPTDTVYGIGCLLEEKAIKRLYKIKNRPLDQPTALLISENEAYNISRTCAKCDMEEFFNGKTTLIISIDKINIDVSKILVKDNKIGIRTPNHKWLQELITEVGPIVASSANIKGEPAPKEFKELSSEILEGADLVIKSAEKASGIPSTVYDIEKNKFMRF